MGIKQPAQKRWLSSYTSHYPIYLTRFFYDGFIDLGKTRELAVTDTKWTTHLPEEFHTALRDEFRDAPGVISTLDEATAESWERLEAEIEKSIPNTSFLNSPTCFVTHADEYGVGTLYTVAARAARRQKLLDEWLEEHHMDIALAMT